MGFYLVCGVFQPEGKDRKFQSASGPRGNGKTITLVHYGLKEYMNGAIVLSNFPTFIPGKDKGFSQCMSFKEMIEWIYKYAAWLKAKNKKVVILLTEGWGVLSHYMSAEDEAACRKFINQIRKLNITIYIDSQRYRDLPPILRDNLSASFIPSKQHDDGTICTDELCEENHFVIIGKLVLTESQRWILEPIEIIECAKVGRFYDSKNNEPILEPGGSITDEVTT
jgi:hypothetical protein